MPLTDVILLGVKAGRAARGTVAFEPAGRPGLVSALVRSECSDQPTQHEETLGGAERPLVLMEAVEVPVAFELGVYSRARGGGSRITMRQGTTDGPGEQGRVHSLTICT